MLAFDIWLAFRTTDYDRKLAAACDQTFQVLLSAKDTLDFDRAKYLLTEARCSIRDQMVSMN